MAFAPPRLLALFLSAAVSPLELEVSVVASMLPMPSETQASSTKGVGEAAPLDVSVDFAGDSAESEAGGCTGAVCGVAGEAVRAADGAGTDADTGS